MQKLSVDSWSCERTPGTDSNTVCHEEDPVCAMSGTKTGTRSLTKVRDIAL